MAITVVRLAAGAFMLVSLLNLALYWANIFRNHTAMQTGRILWLSIPLLIGILLMATARKIAKRINEYLDIE